MIFRASDGVKGILMDLDTNEAIPKPIWFNDVDGTFEAFMVERGRDGKWVTLRDEAGEARTYWAKGRMRFIPRPTLADLVKQSLKDKHKRADLAKAEELAPKAVRQRPTKLPVPIFGLNCQAYGCIRMADYSVSDEVELPPEVIGGVAFPRADTIAVHHWCAWHYKAPKMFDDRGELMVTRDEIRVRPG